MRMTDTERDAMRKVADHALDLHADGRDIVFTAAIVKDGRIIVQARNEVGDTNDVSRHAEVVAMAQAADILGTRDLSGCTLLASCQPCEMCLSAMRWAQIDRVVFGAQQDNADAAFFRFPQMRIADFQRACDGAFWFLGGIEEDRIGHIYAPGAAE
ncbi:nucleoside deaminase [Loktanella sp. M215]|uniref:nucleoside deaminase n=1 Tax=Loktanella sp. M215 TaxID=2675431 RepID=UPI001F210DF1|nr:nucleoside deaminase [Loktanella sp. M215]MCF7698206.1 nucleoside deaminase [Loktanella sp. M215]